MSKESEEFWKYFRNNLCFQESHVLISKSPKFNICWEFGNTIKTCKTRLQPRVGKVGGGEYSLTI